MNKADQRDFDSHYEYWDKIKGIPTQIQTECREGGEMRKTIIECEMCGQEIKEKAIIFYHLEMLVLSESIGPVPLDGPKEMDICRYCLKNILEPYGKWPEPPEPKEAMPVDTLNLVDGEGGHY